MRSITTPDQTTMPRRVPPPAQSGGRPNRATRPGLRKVTIRAIPAAVTVGSVTASAR